jgi:hypothetical protein
MTIFPRCFTPPFTMNRPELVAEAGSSATLK